MKRYLSLLLCALLVAQASGQDRLGRSQDKPLDSKRTGFAPAVVRFANLAPQDATTWAGLSGAAAVTTGITAPDGTTDAAKLSISSPPEGYKRLYDTTRTVAEGDWIIAGVWVKAVSLQSGLSELPSASLDGAAVATIRAYDETQGYRFDIDSANYRNLNATVKADTEWEWVTTAAKIALAPAGNQARLQFELNCSQNRTLAFYAPVLLHVSSGQMTDDEAEGLLQNLYSVPDNVSAGVVATLRGQSFQSKLMDAGGQVWNVKAFGAKGTGEADEKAAFLKTLSKASNGQTIYLPQGNYRLDSTLTINKRVNIRGEGAASAITCNVGTGADCIVIDGSTDVGTYTDNVSYRDFAVLGGVGAARNGVVFRNVTHADVSNVHVATGTSASGYGVVLEGCLISTWQLTVNAAMNYPYTATSPENGILVKGSSTVPSNANLFLYPAVVISNTSGESFFIDGSSGTAGTFNNWIVGGNIEGGGLNGLHIKNATYWNVQSIHLENTSGAGDYNRVRTYIENCSHGQIGPGVGLSGLFLVNSDQITLDGIIADYVSLDSNSDRNRVGRIQYNVTGLGSFADAGSQTTYLGELDVPGTSNGFTTGIGATGHGGNLLRNGGAEYWAASPIDWSVDSGSLTKTGSGQADTTKLYGDYAAKTASGIQYIFVNAPEPDLSLLKGQTVTVTAWVRIPSGQATQPNISLQVWIDGGASAFAGQSTATTDAWVRLSSVFSIPSSATQVQAVLRNTASGAGGFFYADGVSVVPGRTAAHSEPARLPDALALNLRNSSNYRTRYLLPTGQAADYQITMPNGYGVNGQFIQTDGAGGWTYATGAVLNGTTNYYPFFNSSSTITTSGSLLQNFSGNLIVGSHVLFTDNTHDIGVASDNRPRNVYVATSLTSPRIYLGGGSASFTSGSGSPEGVVVAEPGSKYQRTNGTEYIKTSGSDSNGWTLVSTGGSGTINSGTAKRFSHYAATGTTLSDTPGVEYQSGASPNVQITAQNAAHTPLKVKLAASHSVSAFELLDSSDTMKMSLTLSGGANLGGDSTFSLNGTSTSFPRTLSLSNVNAGTAFRWEMESQGTGIQNREGGKLQLSARYGVKLVGSRNSTSVPSFETGASTDPALYVENGNTGASPFVANAISSTSVNVAAFQLNGSNILALGTSGLLTGTLSTSNTGTSFDGRVLTLTSTGTAAANFGLGQLIQLENGSGSLVDAGRLAVTWLTATAGSETSRTAIQNNNAGIGLGESFVVEGDQNYGVMFDQGDVSGSVTINFQNGNHIRLRLIGNITSTTFTNMRAGARYVLRFVQDNTGTRTWTPPTTFKYPGGITGNVLTGSANAVDKFVCDSDGTNLYCDTGSLNLKNP